MNPSLSDAKTIADQIAELEAEWPSDKTPSASTLRLAQVISKQLSPRGQGLCGVAQINTSPGDLEGNARRIMRAMAMAESLELDWLITPELSLMGYPPRDIIGRHPFLVQENERWLAALAQKSGKTRVAVGYVEDRHFQDNPGCTGRPYYNSVGILAEGQIQARIRKLFLPEYNEFEDQRQFQSAPYLGFSEGNPCIELHGKRYAFSICEDVWNDPDFFEYPLYTQEGSTEQPRDLIQEWRQAGAQALINLSASPSRLRKAEMKHALLSHTAKKAELPLLYVNQVGSVDEVSFDGGSSLYHADGRLVAKAMTFEEQFWIADLFGVLSETQDKCSISIPVSTDRLVSNSASSTSQKAFDAFDEDDLPRLYALLKQGIRDYFRKSGFKRAVLGLSGGLDSSVTVVLLADALGAENVLGVSMPSSLTQDDSREDAESIAKALGIQFIEIPIVDITQSFQTALQKPDWTAWGSVDTVSNAAENIQAISRATVLRQLGNQYRAFPVATSDKSELYMGYATVNGDMSGALAPLGDVTKSKVRQLAAWLNTHRVDSRGNALAPCLPDAVIQKPSGADLKRDPITGKLVTAESELMPYAFADEIIWRLENFKQSQTEMLKESFQYEASHAVSAEQKAAWIAHFFKKMTTAVFKWFVVPPVLISDGKGSIAKTDYHHPIVASRIAWMGHSDEAISEVLFRITPIEK
jgi:NAD+ synthase/NAD+ synthase (glutamine-hydrolysing)